MKRFRDKTLLLTEHEAAVCGDMIDVSKLVEGMCVCLLVNAFLHTFFLSSFLFYSYADILVIGLAMYIIVLLKAGRILVGWRIPSKY